MHTIGFTDTVILVAFCNIYKELSLPRIEPRSHQNLALTCVSSRQRFTFQAASWIQLSQPIKELRASLPSRSVQMFSNQHIDKQPSRRENWRHFPKLLLLLAVQAENLVSLTIMCFFQEASHANNINSSRKAQKALSTRSRGRSFPIRACIILEHMGSNSNLDSRSNLRVRSLALSETRTNDVSQRWSHLCQDGAVFRSNRINLCRPQIRKLNFNHIH
jgi:hypothetical protein